MTDWERVGKLRAQGTDWEEIASDKKVGFHPPTGAAPGRALRALYFRRQSRQGDSGDHASKNLRSERARIGSRPRLRWVIGGAGVAVFVVLILVILFVFSPFAPKPGTNPGPASTGTTAEFNYLSQQSTDACQWPGVSLGDETGYLNWINGMPGNVYIQGSCCTPMDYPDYSNQTASLRAYASIAVIAPDPYNVPSQVAKAAVAGESLSLTAAQQSTLSTAAGQTNDNGWCCCQCWAYYAHEGLAKTLVVQYGYDVQQVVTVINLQDCCGGPGQMSGM